MKKVGIPDLKVGKVYYLVNGSYRKPEVDKLIFELIELVLNYGKMRILKDLSSDDGWKNPVDHITFLDSDKIYELSEKEHFAWMI